MVVSMFWVGIVISYGSDWARSNHSMMMPVLRQQARAVTSGWHGHAAQVHRSHGTGIGGRRMSQWQSGVSH